MKAYIHIGTPKTGTTVIQKFFKLNRSKILNKYILYPKTVGDEHHQTLAGFAYNISRLTTHRKHLKLYNNYEYINYRKKILKKLKEEICGINEIVFSSEVFQEQLSKREIYRLKKYLIFLGFTEVKIIVYLRNTPELFKSLCSMFCKNNEKSIINLLPYDNSRIHHICNHKQTLQWWGEIFGKENLIVRLFDNNEFYQGDLLKDFIHSIGLEWDDEFIIPPKQNESLDLLGIELLRRVNSISSRYTGVQPFIKTFCEKHFTSKDFHLKFQPPKEVVQSYIDYFEESNEWVRKEFFPHKERLFPKKNLSNYKENYELKEMKPEYWDKIAEFIADIVKTKNQNIADKTNIIQNKDKIITDQTTQIKSLQVNIKDSEVKLVQIQTSNNTLSNIIKEKDNIINSNINHINQLQNNIQERSTQLNQIQSKLSFQTKYGTAKIRIQNQLSYKLGQAMIVNSKSFLGYLIMPMALLSIMISHKQEQKIYQEKIKKNPSLKLPPLESYPDYKEALKFKNQFSYKLGEALIQANKTWYKGGGMSNCYLKLGS
ncbi:hypothetical protein [Campylobacter coli]|uniref:hypothetical protein n=2 Tax=Campylobacter coli TaxID=195 RepID=UPI002163330C|nr:hypothetical protein [Campylobacter coli]MDS1287946.1 hypothetical protein [Campylobacter coli]MDS1296197.1 hypothetical protein [Campylobacter coli]MDS1306074.1 hypothetical protein [Campylobacter coli]MDS1366859.1 hypothetical protein [Campylobacter coli]MDS1390356.1 hypothetical protein [Campylobacter coli]